MSVRWIRAGRVAVVVVAVIVAAISYAHIRDLALSYGGSWLTAPLLPLGIDGAVAAFTVFMHQATGLALWLSRFGLLVAIGMTVAFNTAYGAAFGVTGAVIWSSPAVLLVICIEVSVLTVRKAKPVMMAEPEPTATSETTPMTPELATMTGSQQPTQTPTVTLLPYDPFAKPAAALAVERNVSKSTIQRDRRKVKAAMAVNGNGAHH